MIKSPPDRRFRFTLRAMLVVVTIFGVLLGFVFNWIHLRRAFRNEAEGYGGIGEFSLDDNSPYAQWAPFPLWCFGEKGVRSISYNLYLGESDRHLTADEINSRPAKPEDEATIARAKWLFPEADIARGGYVRVISPANAK